MPRPDRTFTPTAEQAISVLDGVLRAAELPVRVLGLAQRGTGCDVGGWPLSIGIGAEDGLLRAQAPVLGRGQVDPHDLLHDHRKRPFARFTHADGGEVWVEAELPLVAATPELVDAMLGALIEAATLARERARASHRNPA